jgi:TonB-linked SusC/RagA family outer membrane protein
MNSVVSRIVTYTLGLACALALPWSTTPAQTGAIAGRVLEQGSQRPISEAQVVIVGTVRGARTGEDGQYRFTGVAPGAYQVRALRIGYQAMTQTVRVSPNETATADFVLPTSAIKLDEVLVSATGESQRRRETGNSTATITVDSSVLAVAPTFSDILSSRSAGVTVQQSTGQTGGGSRIRIRGSNSVSLSNDPLIIMDGVRLQSTSNSLTPNIYVGGQQPSRFNDINPEDIENIEVIKGPAAAALYGTAAANGVIQITTKRGRAGKPKWNAYVEGGRITETTDYPANYATFGAFGSPDDPLPFCTLDSRTLGQCTVDSLVSWNPLEQASPFSTGYRRSAGLSVSGGGEAATYYVAGDIEREQGVYEINYLRRTNVRANLRTQLRDNLDLAITTGYLESTLRLPQNDNNILGTLGGGLLGNAQDCSPQRPCGSDTTSRGYILGQTPQELFAIRTMQGIQRYTGGLNSNYRPLSWLSAVVTAGADVLNRDDNETTPPNRILFADLPLGNRTSDPFQLSTYTANGSATGTFDVTPTFRSTSSVGGQLVREELHMTHAFGRSLLEGTGSLSGTSAGFQVGESTTVNTTVGAYLQQQVAWRDRVFLTGAVRGDKNSAFGSDFGTVTYPSVSFSWVLGEESFFPTTRWVSGFRLRSAYGESGQRPSFRDAITYLSPVAVTARNGDVPAVTIGGTGNTKLKPEKSGEFEVGFDAGFFDQKVGFEFTYYRKTTRDALIARLLPVSAGLSVSRFENLGEVRNSGIEMLANAKVLDIEPVTFDVTLNFSTNSNKLLKLGEGIAPILFGANSVQRHQEGYPLGGFWARPYTFSDIDGDGIISRAGCPGATCEITLADSDQFLGAVFPKREMSIRPSLTFFKLVNVAALIDHRGGNKHLNFTARFRCVSFGSCQEANDPASSLEDQARVIAGLEGSDAGYIEDASFTKLRELSVTLSAPKEWTDRLRTGGVSLTLAGRNLKTWTDYRGFDPEINENGQSNFLTDDFLTQPPVRYWTARLNVNF